jgi:iron complex outermembrane receptor protein
VITEKKLAKTIRLLCVSGVLVAGAVASNVQAQETVQRVEITGSSIKRIAKEGALPVQTLSNADIQKSGAKTVEDLVQNLPAMQGFTASASSVNGGGGGVQTASVHGIGERYTLVLLNGRRVAPFGTGSAVNLASIPMAAVERVEVLTDGASALYGSDAIAGVVNFILKKNQTDAVIEATYNRPTQDGGTSANIAISKGFGDLNKDGYNVLLSYAHDQLKELTAQQRDFGKSGLAQFTEGGKRYSLYQLAVNTAPASATLNLHNGKTMRIQPSYAKNKTCGPNSFLVKNATDESCWYDYAGAVLLQPSSKRDSFFASGNFKINEDTTFFAEAVYSDYSMTAYHAPGAQPVNMSLTGSLYTNNVVPYLAQYGLTPADVKKATAQIRFADAGGRSYDYDTKALHLAFGVNGTVAGIDYTASYVHSENTQNTGLSGGWVSKSKFNELVASGSYNPFFSTGGASPIASATINGQLDETKVKLDTLSLRGSTELFNMKAGAAQVGFGGDVSKQTYDYDPTPLAQGPNPQQPNYTEAVFGKAAGALPAQSSRNSYGVFGEIFVPVTKQLDMTASVRYDSYSAVKNKTVFDRDAKLIGSGEQGDSFSKATYKISAAYRPVDSLLVRASYATGFKTPSMSQITNPVSEAGVTSGAYDCPVKAPDPRAVDCKGKTQYDLLSGGNALKGANGLKPEKSTQYTLGFRVEPINSLSLGLDLWSVKLKDQITDLPETLVFGNPGKYSSLFSTVYDATVGGTKLAALLPTYNLAESNNKGIDWDHSYRTKTGLGDLSVQWTGTYMLKSDFSLPGSPVEDSIGRFDSFNNVVFRVISRVATTLKQNDKFSHTVAMNYKSGYHDMFQPADWETVREVNADGSLGKFVDMKRDVKQYVTFDWQTRFQYSKALVLTMGVKNILDTDPPFTVRTAGGGNQSGFDARYANPLGRQIYVTGSYRF